MIDSGECGENVTWTLDSDGTLTISGSGAMYDYDRSDGYGYYSVSRPWNDYSPKYSWNEGDNVITDIVVGENVTAIGKSAFAEILSLETVTILNPDCEIRYAYIAPPNELGNAAGLTICNVVANSDAGYSMPTYYGVIKGYAGSTVQAYAGSLFEYKFEAIDGTADVIGDVNADTHVDSSDAAFILRHYAVCQSDGVGVFTEEQLAVADYNKDSSIDSSDAALILKAYAEKQAK